MYRIGLTPNFEGHVDLSIAINDPDIPTKGRFIDQMSALGARVYCTHDMPVERPMLGVREYEKVGEPLTRAIGVGKTQCRKQSVIDSGRETVWQKHYLLS